MYCDSQILNAFTEISAIRTVYFPLTNGDRITTKCLERLYVGNEILLVIGRSGTSNLWILGTPQKVAGDALELCR